MLIPSKFCVHEIIFKSPWTIVYGLKYYFILAELELTKHLIPIMSKSTKIYHSRTLMIIILIICNNLGPF